jgi:hemoglobin/transferrin/lactoferrin receptor protein
MKNKILTVYCLIVLASFSQVFAQSESLGSETTSLNPVVVTSDVDKQGAPLTTAPGSIVKRDSSALKNNAADSLSSSVGLEPNVDFVGGPRGQAESPQIRGLGSQRILFLEDGVRQNFQNGHNGRVFSDFSLIESLEVVKGPWSSLYGSGAMGGVISFRKSTADDYIRRTGKDKGIELALDGGSAADELGQRATAFAKLDRFDSILSYHHSKAGDIRLGHGQRLPYSAEESGDFYSALGFNISSGQILRLKLERYAVKSVTPLDPETETTSQTELGDSRITKSDVVGDYSLVRGRFDFHAKPFLRETEIKKARLSDGRTDVQTVQTTGVDTWNNLTLGLNESITSVVTTGIEFFKDRDQGERDGATLSSFPSGTSEQLGIYLQPSIVFNKKLSVVPGIRYDSFKMLDSSGKSSSNSGERTSLKAYSSYEYLPERLVFVGWGQAYNAPRLQDLYITGQHFPGNFFVPNPDLKPESAETWEFGSKNHFRIGQDDALVINGTYFITEAKDFIARSVDAAGGTTTFENLDKVNLHGFEISSLWQHESFGAGVGYGQVRSQNKSTGEPLADTLPDQWSGKLEYYLSDRLTFGTDLILAEKQYRVPTGTEKTGGFFTENFFASYASKTCELVLRVNNAYDKDYRKHASSIHEVGRDLRLTSSWVF